MSKRGNATRSKTKSGGKLTLHKKVVTASAMKRKVLSSIASSSSRELDESSEFSDVRTRSGVAVCRRKIQTKLLDLKLPASAASSDSTSTSADDIAESHDSPEQLDYVDTILENNGKLCPSCNRLILDAFDKHVKICLREKFQSGRQSPVLLQQEAEDEALARQLQEQETGNVAETVSTSDPICCQICQKDLSHLNSQRRLQHVNTCIDMSEKAEKEKHAIEKEMSRLKNVGLDCPMCGRHHKAESSRQIHMKKCANELKVSREQLLELLKQQKEEQEIKLAAIQPCDLKKVKGKPSSSSLSRARGQRKPKKREADEDTQVALALSSSLVEEQQKQERQLMAQLTHMHEGAGLVEGGQGKKKAPARKGKKIKDAPVSLLMQLSSEEARRRIEQRASMLLASRHSEQILPSTPVFIRSILNKALAEITEGVACKTLYQRDLWHLAGHTVTSSITKDIRLAYYVSKLMPPVTMSCVEAGSKIKRMSVIPGRNVSILKDPEYPVLQEADQEQQSLSQHDGSQVESGPVQTQTLMILAELAAEADDPDQISLSSTQSGNADDASPGEGDSFQASGFCPEERLVLARAGQELQESAVNELPCILSVLVDDPQYSDIKLITKGGGSVSGHRVIISALCPALLQSVSEDNCLDLSDFSHGSVICLMKYIYAREFRPTWSILEEVKLLAERNNLPTLSSLCEHVEKATSRTSLPDFSEEETGDLDNINTCSSLDTLMKTLWNEEKDVVADEQEENNSNTEDKQEEELDEAIEFLLSQKCKNYTNSNSNTTEDIRRNISVDSENSNNEEMLTDVDYVGFKPDNEDDGKHSNMESVHSACLPADILDSANIGQSSNRVDNDLGEKMDFEDDGLAFKITYSTSDDDKDGGVNAGAEDRMDIDMKSSDSSENSESNLGLEQQQLANSSREPAVNRSYSPLEKNSRAEDGHNTSINDLIFEATSMDEPDYSFIATSQVIPKGLRQMHERRSMTLMDRMESKSLNRSTSELFSDDSDIDSDNNREDGRLVNINTSQVDVCLANLDSKSVIVNENEDYETVNIFPHRWINTATVDDGISVSTSTSVSCRERQNTKNINTDIDASEKQLSIDNTDISDSTINDVDSINAMLSDKVENETSNDSKETSWLIPGTPEDKVALCVTDDAVYTKSYKICLPTLNKITNYSGSVLDNSSSKQDAPSSSKSCADKNNKLTSKGKANDSDEYSYSKSAEATVAGTDISISKYDHSSKEPSHIIQCEYQNHTRLINKSALCSDLCFSNVDATQSGPQMSTPMMVTHKSRTHIKHKRQSIHLSPVHLNPDRDEIKLQNSVVRGNEATDGRVLTHTPDSGSKRLRLIADPRLVLGSKPSSDTDTNHKYEQSHDNLQSEINTCTSRGKADNNEFASSPKFHGKWLKPSKKGESQNKVPSPDDLSDTDSEEVVLLMDPGLSNLSANVNSTSVIRTPSHDKSGVSPAENQFLVLNNSPKLTFNVKRHSNLISDTNVNTSPTLMSRNKRRSNIMSDRSHSPSSCSDMSDNDVSNRHFSKRRKFNLNLEKSELAGTVGSQVHEKSCDKSANLPSSAIDLTGDSDEEELEQNEQEVITHTDTVSTKMDGHDGDSPGDHHHDDMTYNDAGVWDDFDDDGFGMNIVTCGGQGPGCHDNTPAPGQEMMTTSMRQEDNEEIPFPDIEYLTPSAVSDNHNSTHNDISLHPSPSDNASQNEANMMSIANSPCVRLHADAVDCEISDLDNSFAAGESDYGSAVSVIKCATTDRSGGRTVHDISMSDAEDLPSSQIADVPVAQKTPAPVLKKPKKKTVWHPPSPFTPMPNYEKMATPLLKEAVQNVGVKPVGKKRMILFLKDVYHQTHQYETDSEFEGSFSAAIHNPIVTTSKSASANHASKKTTFSSNAAKKLPSTAQVVSKPSNFCFEKPGKSVSPTKNPGPVKSRKKTVTEKAFCSSGVTTAGSGGGSIPTHGGDVGGSSTSQESTDESYDEMLEESVLGCEAAAIDQECEPDLNLKLMRMFKGDPDLYNRILLYEPLEFDWLKGRVKEAGIKCAAPKLQNFLDERCITFTMRSQRGTVKRRGRVKKTKKPS